MEKQINNIEEVKPSRRYKGLSALSVIAVLSLSLIGSNIIRDQVCNSDPQKYDIFSCWGINGFIIGHFLIAGKPIRDGIESILSNKL